MALLISIIIAAVIFGVGVFLQHKPDTIEVEKAYESESSPSSSSTVISTSIPSPSADPTANDYGILVYPDAHFVKQIQAKKYYETDREAGTVFDWYKQMFADSQFAVRTSIKTRTNDVFTGILKAEKGSLKLSISIDQESKEVQTTIVSEVIK